MVHKTLLSLFSLICVIALSFSYSAQAAQDGISRTMEIEVDEYSVSFFPRYYLGVQFFNNPQESESKFTMRLSSHGTASGCVSMVSDLDEENKKRHKMNGDYGIKYASKKMKITISEPELELAEEPRYSNHDCEIKHNSSYVDIPLNRDDMIERGVNKMSLTSVKYGDFSISDIEVTKEKFVFKNQSQFGSYYITFWFFPKNAVVLHAPQAKSGMDVTTQLRAFGKTQGLVPMEDHLKKYELPYDAKSYAFFTDTTGDVVGRLSDVGEYKKIGKIMAKRTVFGPDGPVDQPYRLDVMASLPGQPAE